MSFTYPKHFLLVTFLVLSIFSLSAQSRENIKKEIEKILYFDTALDLDNIPSLEIGIINGDSTFYFSYHFDENKKDSLDENTIFEIGDISKAFTALMCFKLAEEKKIDFADSLIFSSEGRSTLQNILSHRSGFPLRPEGFGEKEIDIENPYANFSRNDLESFLNSYKKNSDFPEGEFHYSHVGYAALELYLEEKLGQSYDQLLQKFCNDLDLEHTFFENDSQKQSGAINGYSRIGKLVPPGEYPSFGASEGVKSSAKDLLNLARRSWFNPPPWLLASFENSWLMQRSQELEVSTGWYIQHHKKFQRLVLQSGSSSGHRSFLAFVPETQTAVVVLSNSEKGLRGLGYLIIKMLNFDWKHPKGRLRKH